MAKMECGHDDSALFTSGLMPGHDEEVSCGKCLELELSEWRFAAESIVGSACGHPDVARREGVRLMAESDRMRPVVEAALEFLLEFDEGRGSYGSIARAKRLLLNAADAYRATCDPEGRW